MIWKLKKIKNREFLLQREVIDLSLIGTRRCGEQLDFTEDWGCLLSSDGRRASAVGKGKYFSRFFLAF